MFFILTSTPIPSNSLPINQELITEIGVANYLNVVIVLSLIAIMFYMLRYLHHTLKDILNINKELLVEVKNFQEIHKERNESMLDSIERVDRHIESYMGSNTRSS